VGCPLPQGGRVDNSFSDANFVSGFGLPSKLELNKLNNTLYLFDRSKGVYEIDLTKLVDNSNLSNEFAKLISPINSLTYYNITTKAIQTNTNINFYTVDFTSINDGINSFVYSIVRAQFDPDKENDSSEETMGTYFANTNWYYLYMNKKSNTTNEVTTDLEPLSNIPVSVNDINYKSDSASYAANYIYIVKNAIYLSSGSNDKALRYIQLKDDYTISDKFKQNLSNGNFEKKFAIYNNSSISGIINSGKIIATNSIPSFVFMTSKDEGSKGIFVYKDDNPSDYLSTKEFKKNITFEKNIYPYSMLVNPFNKNEIYFSSSDNLYTLDISKLNDSTSDLNILSKKFFSDSKNVSNIYLYEDEVTKKQKIVCSIYNPNSIPDSTDIKIYDIETKNEDKKFLVEGLLSNVVVHNGYLYGTCESLGKLMIKKL